MPVKKRGNKYYSVYISPERKETWISLDATNKRDAQKKHNLIMSAFKRERATKQLTIALLDLAKSLALNEIEEMELETPLAQIERMAQMEAQRIINDMIPVPPLMASELWKRYNKSSHGLKPSTLKTKSIRFNRFEKWAGDRDMRSFSTRDCMTFLKHINTGASQTSNNYISDLSSVWKASPELPNPWTSSLRRKPNSKRKHALTLDQVEAVLNHTKANNLDFWYSATLICYYTGFRLTDIVHLEYSQISEDYYFDLPPRKTDRTGRRVRVPIHPDLQAVLPEQKGNRKYIFPDAVRKYKKDQGGFTTEFTNILTVLDIKQKARDGYGFHSLRHTFVTNAIQAGIDIKQIQAVVGHTEIDVTDGYYHGEKYANLSQYPSLRIP